MEENIKYLMNKYGMNYNEAKRYYELNFKNDKV